MMAAKTWISAAVYAIARRCRRYDVAGCGRDQLHTTTTNEASADSLRGELRDDITYLGLNI
jgi:hypothetical protein